MLLGEAFWKFDDGFIGLFATVHEVSGHGGGFFHGIFFDGGFGGRGEEVADAGEVSWFFVLLGLLEILDGLEFHVGGGGEFEDPPVQVIAFVRHVNIGIW